LDHNPKSGQSIILPSPTIKYLSISASISFSSREGPEVSNEVAGAQEDTVTNTFKLDFQRCSEKHYQSTQSMYGLSKHKLSCNRFTYFPINPPKSSKENNLDCFASISSTTKSTLSPIFSCTRARRIPPNSSTSRLRLKPRYLHFHAKYL